MNFPLEVCLSGDRAIEPIEHLYCQMHKISKLNGQVRLADEALLNDLQALEKTAQVVIEHLTEQKKVILQRFDHWILPIAQDVLNHFIQDAEQLKSKLDENLSHLDQTSPLEWEEQAMHWVQLCQRWHDQHALTKQILDVVVERTQHLIDKDIQVIRDYQIQSLAHIPKKSKAFKDIEQRLALAIEEPLHQLLSFRNQLEQHLSLQQTSEWVARLQEHRENYFDQLLMKIDHVMKDVVHIKEKKDETAYLEVEGELIFVEQELHHIDIDLSCLVSSNEEAEKGFLFARLEGVLEHLEGLEGDFLPQVLKQRIQALKTKVSHAMSYL